MATRRANSIFFLQAEDGIRDRNVTGVQTCALPISGGTLTFMVGGSDGAFDKAKPFLEPMAKAVIHAGELGAGQAAKICNNMILGATMAVRSEERRVGKEGCDRLSADH